MARRPAASMGCSAGRVTAESLELEPDDGAGPDGSVVVGRLSDAGTIVVDARIDPGRPPEVPEVEHERGTDELVGPDAERTRVGRRGSGNSTRIQYSTPA